MTVVRRLTGVGRTTVRLPDLTRTVVSALAEDQAAMLIAATERQDARIVEVAGVDDGTVPERDDEPDLVAFVARSY